MPLDGDLQKFTVPDIFNIERFISWLRDQPGEARYFYGSVGDCLLHRWLKYNGVSELGERCQIYTKSGWFTTGWDHYIATPCPHTFAGALARAESYLDRG